MRRLLQFAAVHPLSLIDCKEALFSMPANKSPGSDGFPSEFYHFFWDDIGCLVVNSLNYAYSIGELSPFQKQGVISLIPKPNKDLAFIKNWRPIALLNIDYKIAAKTLANRFKYVLHSIISPEQTGFLKGRYIGENVRIVLDTISYCNTHSIQGSLVFLYFEKAFNSLDHSFIDYVFAYFNIDHTFRKWIRTLYYNAEACVSNYGYCGNYFAVLRGVQQGCPLSPYIIFFALKLFMYAY